MADADNYYGMALWYAWGRLDGREYAPTFKAKLDAFEFASEVKQRRVEFTDGKTVSFESIQGQWQRYIESKDN